MSIALRTPLFARHREPPAHRAARYGLVSAWNLEDTSDSYGANTLTNNAVVTFVAGKVGSGANFVRASSQFLSRADNASLSTGNIDYGGCLWFNMTSKPATDAYIFEKANSGGAANDEYTIKWQQSGDRIQFIQRGSGTVTLTVASLAPPALATWYFLRWWHDSVADTLNAKINEGSLDTITTGGAFPSDGPQALAIGSRSAGANFWDGLIDGVCFFKSPPGGIAAVIEEIGAYLYNGGAGRAYPSGWT